MIILEALGAIFSIMGAFLMSRSSKNDTRPLYWAFVSFFVSNLALLTFFTLNGKIPVILQMILFFATAILGIYRLTLDRKRDVTLMSIILSIYILILVFTVLPNMGNIDFTILFIDLLAASIAIFGSFILSSKNHIVRGYAFVCFFVADVIFVYIGYTNAFYFFMVQSAFYLYTSTKGYLNTMHEEIDAFMSKYKKT